MASLYDEILAAGGYVLNPAGAAGQLSQMTWSPLASYAERPTNFTRLLSQFGAAPNSAAGAWRGMATPDSFAGLEGYEFGQIAMPGEGGQTVNLRGLRGPDGRMVSEGFLSQDSDWTTRLIEGMIAAGATAGLGEIAGLWSFGSPASAASGASPGAAAGGLGELGSVAQAFPVAPQAASTAIPLGSAGAGSLPATGLATAPSIGSVPALQGAAWSGAGAGAATAAAVDPITAYLTTGASEGSTAFNAFTGAGGAAGAVGSSSLSGILQGAGSWLGNLGNVNSALGLVSNLYGLRLARDMREASDPFARFRGFYGDELMRLEANPGMITSRPGYAAGLEAVRRGAASRGYAGSGNELGALARYGQGFYTQEMQRLAGLAGAGQTPGAGQVAAADLTARSIAGLGYGLAPFLSGQPGTPGGPR